MNHIERDTDRFLEAARSAAPDAPVPSCPGWKAADLVWHLTEVQHFWGTIVAGGLQDPGEVDERERPDDYQRLLDLMKDAGQTLATALREADPLASVWTWANDKSVQFILRRQAHEAAIHRVDAELTAGGSGRIEVDDDLAADGVDEMVHFFVAGDLPEWSTFTPDGAAIRLELVNRPATWTLAFGRFTGTSPLTGKTYDLDAAQTAAVETDDTVRGAPAALDLWLWGRGDTSRLEIGGDPAVAGRLRSIAADGTQ